MVASAHPGETGDAAHRVGVGDEVLTQRPARSQAVARHEVAHLLACQRHRAGRLRLSGHHSMRTWMTPEDVDAILAKVSRLRSMMRPATNGPRSATRQVVEAPLDWLVTVTMVPKGSERWAQVPAGASYHEACPVWLWRGGAVVVVSGAAVAGGEVVVVVVVVLGGGGGGLGLGTTGGAGGAGGGTGAAAALPLSVGGAGSAATASGSAPLSGAGHSLCGPDASGGRSRSTTTAAPTAAMRTRPR